MDLRRGDRTYAPKVGEREVNFTQSLSGSNLYTDAHGGYSGLDAWYRHQIVDHAVAYVIDNVHTNSLENFWSLLKRTMRGTYASVEPFHLHRYLDEYAFRFNERRLNDGERFKIAAGQVAGRRVTYKALTGKESATAAF